MTRTAKRLLLLCTLFPACPILAQDAVSPATPQAPNLRTNDDPNTFSISPYASHAFDTDLGDDGASVAVSRAGADTTTRLPLSSSTNFTFGLLAEYSNYDFSEPNFSLDVLNIQVVPGLEQKLSDEWSVFGGAFIQATGEVSAGVSQALNYGGYAGARHKLSDTLSYSFGVAVLTQLEDDVRYAPVFGFTWDITEALKLSLGGSPNGGEFRIQQALSHTVAIAAVAGYEYRQYRLDDDHGSALNDGVLQDTRVPLALELNWKPCKYFAARATVGYVIYAEIEFDDAEGRELSNEDADPTPFVGLSANWQF